MSWVFHLLLWVLLPLALYASVWAYDDMRRG
jgi:hypothetical protein